MLKQFAAVLAAIMLVACGQEASTAQPESVATTASDVKPEAPTAGSLTAQMLFGRWGDNGDCTKDIVFNADGTFRSYTGGAGTWALNGDRVTISGPGGTFEVGVEILNGNTLMIANPDGSFGTSQRC